MSPGSDWAQEHFAQLCADHPEILDVMTRRGEMRTPTRRNHVAGGIRADGSRCLCDFCQRRG